MSRKLKKRLQVFSEDSHHDQALMEKSRRNAIGDFESTGLCSELASICAQVSWAHPSDVQRHCIPRIITPHEYQPSCSQSNIASPFVFGVQAPPGSGKTASYVLPILHHLMNSTTRSFARATTSEIRYAPNTLLHFLSTLIIAPTTELCLQIYNQLLLFGESVRLKVGLLVGGGTRKGVAKGNFREQLGMVQDRTVHVIIGTPGRVEYVLLDSSIVSKSDNESASDMESSGIATVHAQESILKNLRFIVFDEADMMAQEKSMVNGIERLLTETISAQCMNITTQSIKKSGDGTNIPVKELPQLNILLVSATLKHATVNLVWAKCVQALNATRCADLNGDKLEEGSDIIKNSLDIDFALNESFQDLQYIPPAPLIYIASDDMSVDTLTAKAFNKFVEQQFVVVPHHVKLVHLYLMLSPSSEHSIIHTFQAKHGSIRKKEKLLKPKNRKVIIFLNSKVECEVIRATLQLLGLSVCSLHSLQSPQQRSDSLFSFQMNVHPILLTTDVCCRGLDIASVDFIIHYDIPKTIDRYIHRIGRARRESQVHGKEQIGSSDSSDNAIQGQSLLFATEKDEVALRKLEKSIRSIMKRGESVDNHRDTWKLNRRKEIDEDLILRHLDVVLQARLKAEETYSNEFDKEEVVIDFM